MKHLLLDGSPIAFQTRLGSTALDGSSQLRACCEL